jgi:hypothetical protein
VEPYSGVHVNAHAFLTSALDGSDERAHGTHCTGGGSGGGGGKGGLEAVVKKRIPSSSPDDDDH